MCLKDNSSTVENIYCCTIKSFIGLFYVSLCSAVKIESKVYWNYLKLQKKNIILWDAVKVCVKRHHVLRTGNEHV